MRIVISNLFIKLIIGLAMLIIFFLFYSCLKNHDRPDIILITIDTLRWDYLGNMGNDVVHTPNIDWMTKQGAQFVNAYCQVPLTLPSHSSIFTSKNPYAHKVRNNVGFVLDEANLTMAEILSENGYFCAAFISAVPLLSKFGIAQGFSIYDETLTSPLVIGKLDKNLEERFREKYSKEMFWDIKQQYDKYQRTAKKLTDDALNWLQAHHNKKFFLWLHYYDPHGPYTPPFPFHSLYYQGDPFDPANDSLKGVEIPVYQRLPRVTDKQFYIAEYAGEVAEVDHQLGRIFTKLNQLNLLKKSLIIITSDHGESLGEHNYYFAHGHRVFEETIKIPLAMIYPKKIKPGLIISSPVQSIDLLPTVLDLLSISKREDFEGESLVIFLKNPEYIRAKDIYAETMRDALLGKDVEYRCLINYPWKLVSAGYSSSLASMNYALYNLEEDGGENNFKELDLSDKKFHQLMEKLVLKINRDRDLDIKKEMLTMDEETMEALKSLGYVQ